MGFYRGPHTVTDGLVLSLDAGNTKSYQSGSTTWFDKSGNNRNGTLTNGPTFSSANGGSIVFDQVDDSITGIGSISTFSFIQNTGIFTVCAWARLTPFGIAQRMIMGNNQNIATEKGFSIGRTTLNAIRVALTNGSGTSLYLQNSNNNYFINNNWVFVTIVGDGTKVIYYRNGTLFQDGSGLGTLSTGDSTGTLSVGNSTAASNWWSGNIAQVSIYNRTLSAAEVQQNFDATKSRYGL